MVNNSAGLLADLICPCTADSHPLPLPAPRNGKHSAHSRVMMGGVGFGGYGEIRRNQRSLIATSGPAAGMLTGNVGVNVRHDVRNVPVRSPDGSLAGGDPELSQ